MGQLRLDRALHPLAVRTGPLQLALEIDPGPRAARRFQLAPRGAEARVGIRPDRGAHLDRHFLDLAAGEAELVPLHHQLALEHRHPLAMPYGEPLGDGHRLRVRDLGGEPSPALGVIELLALGRELLLGRGEPLAHAREPHGRFGQRVAQVLGPGAGIGGRLREQAVEPGPERFEDAQREDSWKDGGAASMVRPEPAPGQGTGPARDPPGALSLNEP